MFAEKFALGGLLATVFYTVWVRSGYYEFNHAPFWVLCGLFLVTIVYAQCNQKTSLRNNFLKDPLFWSGALFVLLLFYQWMNQAGAVYVHILTKEFVFEPAKLAGPFSVERRLSKDVLLLFVPIWLMLLCVRNIFSRDSNKQLLWAVLINALLLAVVGLVQVGFGLDKMFGFIEMNRKDFIASFWYPNHAGAFFYFMYAVSIGMFFDSIAKKKSVYILILLGISMLTFASVALATLSRAAVLGVCLITASAFVVWVLQTHKRFSLERCLNVFLLGCVLLIFVAGALISFRGGAVLREFDGSAALGKSLEDYDNSRGWQVDASISTFKDFPVFGVGGEGMRHFIFKYLPQNQWGKIRVSRAVHCDPIQFLAEHGAVGFLLMIVALGSVLFSWRRFVYWRFKGFALMVAVGASLVFLHSLIDLPFRNPAVLWYWLLLLALVPALAIDRERT